jgi:hypothetical protein
MEERGKFASLAKLWLFQTATSGFWKALWFMIRRTSWWCCFKCTDQCGQEYVWNWSTSDASWWKLTCFGGVQHLTSLFSFSCFY